MGSNILTISKVANSLVQRKLELEFSIEFEGHLTAFNNVSKIVEFFIAGVLKTGIPASIKQCSLSMKVAFRLLRLRRMIFPLRHQLL